PSPCQTVPAGAADDVSLSGYSFAYLPTPYMAAGLYYLTDELMSYGHGGLYGLLRPFVPVVYVKVRTAYRSLLYLYQYVVVSYLGNIDLAHPQSRFRPFLYKSKHLFCHDLTLPERLFWRLL